MAENFSKLTISRPWCRYPQGPEGVAALSHPDAFLFLKEENYGSDCKR
jgi:hypothetical protein